MGVPAGHRVGDRGRRAVRAPGAPGDRMTVAALYDIHGNAPALAAVIDELRADPPDAVVIGGDVIAGPLPLETLELLRGLPWPVHHLRGNADRAVVMSFDGTVPPKLLEHPLYQADQWVATFIDRAERDWLEALPPVVRLDVDGARRGPVLPRDAALRRGADHGLHAAGAARADPRAGRRGPHRRRPHPPSVRPHRGRAADGQRGQRRAAVRARPGRLLAAARAGRRAAPHGLRHRRGGRALRGAPAIRSPTRSSPPSTPTRSRAATRTTATRRSTPPPTPGVA